MEELIKSFSALGRRRAAVAVAFDSRGMAFGLVGGVGIHFIVASEGKGPLFEFLKKHNVSCLYVGDDVDYAILDGDVPCKFVHIKSLGCTRLGVSSGPYMWCDAKYLSCKKRVMAILLWLERNG